MFFRSQSSSPAMQNIRGGGADRKAIKTTTTTTTANGNPTKSCMDESIQTVKQQQQQQQQHDNDQTIIIGKGKLIEQENLLDHYVNRKNKKVKSKQHQVVLYSSATIKQQQQQQQKHQLQKQRGISGITSTSSSSCSSTTTSATIVTDVTGRTAISTSSTGFTGATSSNRRSLVSGRSENVDFGFTYKRVFYKDQNLNLAKLEQKFINEQFLLIKNQNIKQKQKQQISHYHNHRLGNIVVHKYRKNEYDHHEELPFDNDDGDGDGNQNDHNHVHNQEITGIINPQRQVQQGQDQYIDDKNRNGNDDHDSKQDGGTYSIVQQESEREDDKKDGLEKFDYDSSDNSNILTSNTTISTIWVLILYGIINSLIELPVSMSFGNIIYSNDAFAPYLPTLIKLTVASGVVHQLCFATFSSLPFAVGHVQDAGLIFLSKMATDIVLYFQNQNQNNGQEYNDEELLATATIGLSISTAILGLSLIVIGKARLAGYVQMVPKCVIAGYLAYIGWFCGKSGIRLMVVVVEEGSSSSGNELTFQQVWDNILFILPGIYGAIFIYVSVRTIRHVAVLPSCIILLLVMFYIILYAKGSSIEEATEQGWIRASPNAGGSSPEDESNTTWYEEIWQYLRFDKVVWSALPQLFVSEIGMIFIVALSSSLDIAAIELEVKRPLNYDYEIIMVGMSNFISGLSGGYTGSYIFSQTIFSFRAGIRSRLSGYVLAITEAIVIVTPFPILSYIPNFFYGSLLGMICIDMVYEWLWEYRTLTTTTRMEYFIALITFVMIEIWRVEIGILAGILMYVILSQLDSWKNGGKTERIESNEAKVFLQDDNNIRSDDDKKKSKNGDEDGVRIQHDSEDEHRLLSLLI